MDLLASLNIDALPEQQTRISDDRVRSALEKDPDIKLGFNACCNCGCSIDDKTSVACKGCKRVLYCSNKCRAEDADPPPIPDVGDEEEMMPEALGHSSIMCALLRLCDDDEDADERRSSKNKTAAAVGKETNKQNADDRVRSELESYPATLANIITDGPCYQEVLLSSSRSKRKELVVHVIGASYEAELWYNLEDAADAYSEALENLAITKKFRKVRIIFIGPECPKDDVNEERDMGNNTRLILETSRQNYDKSLSTTAANLLVFFNPGFTCPDYDWGSALSHIKPGTPFLVTTNTEMEGISDVQYLHERGWMDNIPPGIEDIIMGESGGNMKEEGKGCTSFFSENPYAGSRVRQSGTMANDLYVKNKWVFGGFFGKESATKPVSSKRKNEEKSNEDQNLPPLKKKHKVKGSGNSKKKNPALI